MKILELLKDNPDQLMVVLTFFILVGAIVIGLLQISINSNISDLNERALALESHVEVFARPDLDTFFKYENLLIQLENAGLHPIYLENYTLNNNTIEIGGSVIPTHGWFTIPIQKGHSNFELQVIYKDIEGIHYKTKIVGEPIGTSWGIKTLKKEPF